MKTISLRALSRDAPTITEAVLVLHGRQAIGTYRPFQNPADGGSIELEPGVTAEDVIRMKEATVDEVKKAIAVDATKVARPGRPGKPELSKGLGDIPGLVESQEPIRPHDTKVSDPSFGAPRPAPKPK